MIPGLGALGGGGFSQSGSADANSSFGASGGGGFYGINTGTQGGLDSQTLLIIGAMVVFALYVLKK